MACQGEASLLKDLYSEYKDSGFQVITVLLDGDPSYWANKYELTTPVLNDNSLAIWKVYGGNYIPLNFIIDQGMVIRYRKAGFYENDVRDLLAQLLQP